MSFVVGGVCFWAEFRVWTAGCMIFVACVACMICVAMYDICDMCGICGMCDM